MSFSVNEFTFENISTEQGVNTKYFQNILKLISEHENKILHDYMPHDPEGLIKLIDYIYPWFFIVFKKNEFAGFFYCYNWYGNEEKQHSCFLTAAAERKFYGKDTRKALSLFCNYLFDIHGLVKIRVEVLKENALCIKLLEDCRFKREGRLKFNTFVNGELRDLFLYSRINSDYLNDINYRKENRCINEFS